ncbi:DUF4136 domain-containing protein [Thermaurantiacus sp.]
MIGRAFAIGTLIALGACASSNMPRFSTSAAPGFNVSALKTYSWAFEGVQQGVNPILFQSIRDEIDRALAARGFRKVEGSSDFIVAFTLGARDRVDVTNWGPVGPMYTGWGRPPGWGWSFNYRQVDVRNVTEGSLAIDMFDGQTKRPIWHGMATRDLGSSGASPELVSNAVNGLIGKFAATPSG